MLWAMQQIGRKTLVRLLAQMGDSAATANIFFKFFLLRWGTPQPLKIMFVFFFLVLRSGAPQRMQKHWFFCINFILVFLPSAKDGGDLQPLQITLMYIVFLFFLLCSDGRLRRQSKLWNVEILTHIYIYLWIQNTLKLWRKIHNPVRQMHQNYIKSLLFDAGRHIIKF